MCARVCPTETLCEEACVREAAEGKPVEIGRLQRFATDALMGRGPQPFARAAPTGKRVAVVGAGPAGLACAHRLAMLGHEVTLSTRGRRRGGLNEFGIAAYKAVDGFAQAEVDWLLGIGGIDLAQGRRARPRPDARGAARGVRRGVPRHRARRASCAGGRGRRLPGVRPAVDFIAELRQAADLAALPVGRRVVVIGGGMTAIDAAVQSKKLGAEEVTIVYRRGRERMKASDYEQELAAAAGVRIVCDAMPVRSSATGRWARWSSATPGWAGGAARDRRAFALAADQVLLGDRPAARRQPRGWRSRPARSG